MPKLPSSRVALSLESSLLGIFLNGSSPAELPVGIVGIYGIGSYASYPHVHEFLLHADAVLQPYVLVKSLERDVFDERFLMMESRFR